MITILYTALLMPVDGSVGIHTTLVKYSKHVTIVDAFIYRKVSAHTDLNKVLTLLLRLPWPSRTSGMPRRTQHTSTHILDASCHSHSEVFSFPAARDEFLSNFDMRISMQIRMRFWWCRDLQSHNAKECDIQIHKCVHNSIQLETVNPL